MIRYIALATCACLLTTCATYQDSVDSRSVGVSGYAAPGGAGGKVVYTVRYRH